MKTIVIGAGAMGCFFAATMKLAGAEVSIYDTDMDKIEHISKNGIILREKDGTSKQVMVPAYAYLDEAPPADLLIVLVKAYHTARVARDISRILEHEPMVLTLQNGRGNVEELCKHIPEKQVFAGITYNCALELAPGDILHTGSGLTLVGPVAQDTLAVAMEQARLLNNCNLTAGATSDLEPLRWKKLIVNSVIYPLSAINRVVNGDLPKNPDIVRDMVELTVEGVAVAQKAGIPLDYGEIWATVLETCRGSAENKSSMLTDVEKGRFTEIDAINGSIVRYGEINGVDTPANVRIIRKVVAIQGKRDSF